jgi:hypothetical protein
MAVFNDYALGATDQRDKILEFLAKLANDFREFEGEASLDAKFIEEIGQVIATDPELRLS